MLPENNRNERTRKGTNKTKRNLQLRKAWLKWFSKEENRKKHYATFTRWYKNIRKLLIDRKGGKCQDCGSTINLQLHEPNGNDNNHSNKRLTEMRDGKRDYKLLCKWCHPDTDGWRNRKTNPKKSKFVT